MPLTCQDRRPSRTFEAMAEYRRRRSIYRLEVMSGELHHPRAERERSGRKNSTLRTTRDRVYGATYQNPGICDLVRRRGRGLLCALQNSVLVPPR